MFVCLHTSISHIFDKIVNIYIICYQRNVINLLNWGKLVLAEYNNCSHIHVYHLNNII